MNRRQFTRTCAGLAAGVPVLIAGCSSGPKLVPVSGTVTIDGQPVPAGVVQISPINERTAYGNIDINGRFTMTTYSNGDGVYPGSHPAAVVAHETLSSSKQKWHAPKRYNNTETSKLIVEITGPTDNLEIKLTWEGDEHKGPFIEGANEKGEGNAYGTREQ